MNPVQISAGTRVRVNAPDATGVHGKIGTVDKDVYHGHYGTVRVSIDDFGGKFSFLFVNELEVIESKPSSFEVLVAEREQLRANRLRLQFEVLEINKRLALIDKVLTLAKEVGIR